MSVQAGEVKITGRLAILAGRGSFPRLVAVSARAQGLDPYIFAISGEADQDWSDFDHSSIAISNLAAFARVVASQSIGSVILAGGINRRPMLSELRPTWRSLVAFLTLLPALVSSGDDKLLRLVIKILESEGVKVIAAQQVVPDLLSQPGPLGQIRPGKSDQRNIAAAAQAALVLGRLDVGQGAVAVGGRVIALEGLEGTDAMLTRVAELRASKRLSRRSGGVLVKLCKPNQDERADLPSIGVQTIIKAHAAGLSGVAVESGRSLILERELARQEADRLGLFITGITPNEEGPDECGR